MFNHVRRVLAATLFALVIAGSTVGAASATQPGPNGRITFMRFDADGQFQVWAANPDLSHQVQLTAGASDAWFPAWSPDGRRIAFASHRSDPDPTDDVEVMDVFTMRADGSDVRRVTDSTGFQRDAVLVAGWPMAGVLRRSRRLPARAGHLHHPERRLVRAAPASRRCRRARNGRSWPASRPMARASCSPNTGSCPSPGDDGTPSDVEQSALFTVRPDGIAAATDHRLGAQRERRRLVARWTATRLRDPAAMGRRPAGGDDRGRRRRPPAEPEPRPPGVAGRRRRTTTTASRSTPRGRRTAARSCSCTPSYTPDDGFKMGLQLIRPDGTHRTWLSVGEEHQPDWGSARPLR